LSLHIEFLPLFENAARLREILTGGRENSWHMQYLATAMKRELNNISKTAFFEGMKKLKEHANKCIDQGGMYFEE
jgi:uncharacterized hydantoinase/oxoprolinase family protein